MMSTTRLPASCLKMMMKVLFMRDHCSGAWQKKRDGTPLQIQGPVGIFQPGEGWGGKFI